MSNFIFVLLVCQYKFDYQRELKRSHGSVFSSRSHSVVLHGCEHAMMIVGGKDENVWKKKFIQFLLSCAADRTWKILSEAIIFVSIIVRNKNCEFLDLTFENYLVFVWIICADCSAILNKKSLKMSHEMVDLPEVRGKNVNLNVEITLTWKGRDIILTLWATWCWGNTN